MDDLITVIQNFGITQNDEYLDRSLDKIKYTDADCEWETLKSNYSKLKYLSQLFNFYYIPYYNKFTRTLNKFLESIEPVNHYYLNSLRDIEIHEYYEIDDLLGDAFHIDDPLLKLNNVLSAYSILIPIVEDFMNEKYSYRIDDPSFLDAFKN
jgi:hypothetical protein